MAIRPEPIAATDKERPFRKQPFTVYAEAERRIAYAAMLNDTMLDLEIDGLTQFPPLVGLTKLKSLHLTGCGKDIDLAPLAALTGLQSLSLYGADINDLNPLAALIGLQSLNLTGCRKVTDLAPLKGLTGLQSLDLSCCNHVTDLAPLKGLAYLQSLDLSNNDHVTDLAPLKRLADLQSLNLSRCVLVTDLAPLKGLTGLQSLDLSNNDHVTDLAPLEGLTSLQSLNLSCCQKVTDLTPLGALIGLHWLHLSNSGVSSLTSLSNLYNLYFLSIDDTDVSDINPLKKLRKLNTLTLCGTSVSDLSPLKLITTLSDAAQFQSANGLAFTNCPIRNKTLVSYSILENPERTVNTINYLREQQGLPPYYPDRPKALPDALREDPLGASARIEGNHVVLVLDSGDRPEEDGNDTAQAHKEIIRKARALKEDCCGLGNYPGWKRLEETAGFFLEEIDRPFSELGKRSVTLWSLSVSLGSFLEQNREAQNDTTSLTSRLEPNVSRALGDLVVTTANFVRIFETPRKYDAGLVEMNSTPAATEAARQITGQAEQKDILRRVDARVLSSVLDSTAADGLHTRKAHGFGLKSVMNIVVTSLAFLRGGGIKKACEKYVEKSAMTQKLTDFLNRSEEEVLTLYEGAAPDIREAVREALEQRRSKK